MSIKLCYDGDSFDHKKLNKHGARCRQEIIALASTVHLPYQDPRSFVKLPFDQKTIDTIKEHAEELLSLLPMLLVVVGIGGSNLGAKAVYDAIVAGNYQGNIPEVLYMDTVDTNKVSRIIFAMHQRLQLGQEVIVAIITKSGTTTETIANATVIIHVLKQYHPRTYQKFLVIITDKNSKFARVARQERWRLVTIPPCIGGRFSVLSAVGLLPLAIAGIRIDELCRGACAMHRRCCMQTLEENPAISSATRLYQAYQEGYYIHNFFPFSTSLEALGLWYRQLMAESIGKKYDRDGQCVCVGITPTVSLGSTDLHSIVELHLGGPGNTYTTFVTCQHSATTINVPHYKPLETLVEHIQGNTLETLMSAMLAGTQQAYAHEQRPYMTITLPEQNAYYLGQFMQLKMLETVYLGVLFNIDPFKQPHVELYKQETRKLLAHEQPTTDSADV